LQPKKDTSVSGAVPSAQYALPAAQWFLLTLSLANGFTHLPTTYTMGAKKK
jgi:hypothetical protein